MEPQITRSEYSQLKHNYQYQYDPLEDPASDIRLIEIHPKKGSEGLECSLHTYASNSCPPYEALSYAWGDQSSLDRINFHGKWIYVASNLHSALVSLRKRCMGQVTDRRLLVWIDALCIDQDNLEERNDQVQRMKLIYQGAKRVIIYLGDYSEPSDQRIQFGKEAWGIQSLENGSYSLSLAAVTIALHLSMANTVADAGEVSQMLAASSQRDQPGNPLTNIFAWAHLSRLFNRPWFERLWIIQELGVSQEAIVLCGGIEVPWSTVENAAAFILRPAAETPPEIRRFFPLMGAHRVTQVALNTVRDVDKSNILTVLRHTQGASCSDPRDKLYAILGVVEDTADISIDYSRSFDIVYRDWAIKRIIRTKSLDVLSACADSGASGNLPSWVPDLRRPLAHDKSLWHFTHQDHISRDRQKRIPLPPDLDSWNQENLFPGISVQLVLDGSFIGKISSLSEVCDAVTNLPDPTNLTRRLRDIIKALEIWYFNCRCQIGLSQIDSDSSISVIGGIGYALLRSSSSSYGEQYALWRTFDFQEKGLWNAIPDPILRGFEATLFPLVHGCQLFVIGTKNARVGVVAGNCSPQVGDELWILRGGLTPFILRKNVDGHRLISPCFFQDFMEVESSEFQPKSALNRHLSSTKLDKVVLT